VSEQSGKVDHPQAGKLVSITEAQKWPKLEVHTKGSKDSILLGGPSHPVKARVILALYRQSAEAQLKDWRDQVVSKFSGDQSVDMVGLNMIDLQVLSCLQHILCSNASLCRNM
jgi:hypothetical protein